MATDRSARIDRIRRLWMAVVLAYVCLVPALLWWLPLVFCVGSVLVGVPTVAMLRDRHLRGRTAFWFWLVPVALYAIWTVVVVAYLPRPLFGLGDSLYYVTCVALAFPVVWPFLAIPVLRNNVAAAQRS